MGNCHFDTEDNHNFISSDLTDNSTRLTNYECCLLINRYNETIDEMVRIRKHEPFILYNDSYWASNYGPISQLRVAGRYNDKNILFIKFESSNRFYIMVEQRCPDYETSVNALREWFLEPEVHNTHFMQGVVLKECREPTDNIYFLTKVELDIKVETQP